MGIQLLRALRSSTLVWKSSEVEGLAATATNHFELLKQEDKAEGSFIIEKIANNTRPTFYENVYPYAMCDLREDSIDWETNFLFYIKNVYYKKSRSFQAQILYVLVKWEAI